MVLNGYQYPLRYSFLQGFSALTLRRGRQSEFDGMGWGRTVTKSSFIFFMCWVRTFDSPKNNSTLLGLFLLHKIVENERQQMFASTKFCKDPPALDDFFTYLKCYTFLFSQLTIIEYDYHGTVSVEKGWVEIYLLSSCQRQECWLRKNSFDSLIAAIPELIRKSLLLF